jgi:hypothetical protein
VTLVDHDLLPHVRRRMRVIAILAAADRAGLAPLPSVQLHTIAYFADALSPVWGLRILDSQLLKRRAGPLSPTLQYDVDVLVGRGVVLAESVRHVFDDANWRLEASYHLNLELARPILEVASSFEEQASHLHFVGEVVNAVSGLGPDGIVDASASDAAYSDVLVDFGGLLDIGGERSESNLTARVAMRFGDLMQEDLALSDAEMVHLYVRELYKRLERAA